MSFLGNAAQGALRNEATSHAASAGKETLAVFTRSKLALNGAALVFVGFFGVLNVFNPAQAIVSFYLLLFGLMLCAFSLGAGTSWLKTYFGFIFYPDGQLLFLLIAGNLAWSSGLFGVLAAILTNFNALVGWYTHMERPGTAGSLSFLPTGLGGGSRDPSRVVPSSASKAEAYADPDIL